MDFSDWFTNQIIKGKKKKQKENICSTDFLFFIFCIFTGKKTIWKLSGPGEGAGTHYPDK